jgi:predicted DNA-binding protein
MARPKKGTEIGASAGVAFRITPELRGKLDAMAREHGHSLTDEIRAALERHVAKASKSKRSSADNVAEMSRPPAVSRK